MTKKPIEADMPDLPDDMMDDDKDKPKTHGVANQFHNLLQVLYQRAIINADDVEAVTGKRPDEDAGLAATL